jgi:phosphatidylglycerophosphate synthase
MQHTDNRFVVELLTDLQKSRFSPRGWRLFLLQSGQMSRSTARTHPRLFRSWLYVTFLISFISLGIISAEFFLEGLSSTIRFLPAFFFFILYQQSDLYWHLGLNRHPQTGQLFEGLGLPNTLTWLRALGSSFLLARLVSGLHTSSQLALSVFLFSVLTDILDGPIARLTQTQTRLGQIADGEADFCLTLALTLILLQNSLLPLWLACLFLLRFLFPLFAAFSSYFLLVQPIRFGSTNWGKYAGFAQGLYFIMLLAPPQIQLPLHAFQTPLLIVTLILLFIAPLAQFHANRREKVSR